MFMAVVCGGLIRGRKVKLDGWCEGGLGQQRDDDGGCPTMHKRKEGVESPGPYVDDLVTYANFASIPVYLRTTFPRYDSFHLRGVGCHCGTCHMVTWRRSPYLSQEQQQLLSALRAAC